MSLKSMFARYLIRLDDALPTMRPETWALVENLLDEHGIKPMVAVIPNNLDKSLEFAAADLNFWERVKCWKDKGWAVGLHGFNHLYHKVASKRSLVPLHDRSEFVGLSLQKQRGKFAQASRVFSEKGIKPDLFIAPSHSFDENTLKAMKIETQLAIVSDGIALSPYLFDGVWFVPQQLWKFKWRPFGVWTVCLHPNTITPVELEDLSLALSKYQRSFISLDELEFQYQWYNRVFDRTFSICFWALRSVRMLLQEILVKLNIKSH